MSIKSFVEKQLSMLAECGIELADPFQPDDLIEAIKHDPRGLEEGEEITTEKVLDYLSADYSVIYGLNRDSDWWNGIAPAKRWKPFCNNITVGVYEGIENNNSYVEFAREMIRITQGSLVLEDLESYYNRDEGKAWLSFSFKSRKHKIDLKVNKDYVDPRIDEVFIGLLRESDPDKIYIHHLYAGIIACVTHGNLEKLAEYGFEFRPLD